MATTFCMRGSRFAACAALRCLKQLTSQRFGTSAQKGENGFVTGKNCFVAAVPTKHSRRKCEYSQGTEIRRAAQPKGGKSDERAHSSRRRVLTLTIQEPLRLVPDRREQIAAAADGADHRGFGRGRLHPAAGAHDPGSPGAGARLRTW